VQRQHAADMSEVEACWADAYLIMAACAARQPSARPQLSSAAAEDVSTRGGLAGHGSAQKHM
jgi:hypothetical protein